MHFEEGEILSEGFEAELPPAPLERRRKRASAMPGTGDRRRRRRTSRLPGLLGLALLLHAVPVLAALWSRPALLGVDTEGGTGWDYAMVACEGPAALPPGPPAPPVQEPSPPPVPSEAPSPPAPPAASLFPEGGGGASGPLRGESNSLGSTGQTGEPIWNPRPAYPERARDLGQEGTVVLELAIGEDGRVREVRLLSSSGHPLLDRAAQAALGRWRFARPALGAMTLVQEVVFRLESESIVTWAQ